MLILGSDAGDGRVAACYVAHLMGCALSERAPERRPQGCSWEDVLSRARENGVLGLVWRAARGLDGIPEDARRSCERHSRMIALHNVRYEAERSAVCEALRAEGLSVMALKGSPLVACYPDYSMREVGDNDVLYGLVGEGGDGRFYGHTVGDDAIVASDQKLVSRIMGGLGYALAPKDDECHLRFYKEPGLCFELHHALFEHSTPFYGYYENPWAHARSCGGDEAAGLAVLGTAPGKAFSLPPEDELVYAIAHAWKHSRNNGTGIRVVADLIVIVTTAKEFDWGLCS